MLQGSDIDKYISLYPKNAQIILQKIRREIRKVVPGAEEKISYGIPTFDLNGKHLVHFAAFKNHIGFFPTSSGVAAFKKDLKNYKTSKGTIQFRLDKPIPLELIKKIAKYRTSEILDTKKATIKM